MEGLLAALEDPELSGWIMRAKRAGEANRGKKLKIDVLLCNHQHRI